jgi:hypothetical protein
MILHVQTYILAYKAPFDEPKELLNWAKDTFVWD